MRSEGGVRCWLPHLKGKKHPCFLQGFWNLQSSGIKSNSRWYKGAAVVPKPRTLGDIVSAGCKLPEQGCLYPSSYLHLLSHEAVMAAICNFFPVIVAFAPSPYFGRLLLKLPASWKTKHFWHARKNIYSRFSLIILLSFNSSFCSLACVNLTQNIWRP